jgi:hypothetical protein
MKCKTCYCIGFRKKIHTFVYIYLGVKVANNFSPFLAQAFHSIQQHDPAPPRQ